MSFRHIIPALLVLCSSLPVHAGAEIGVDDRRLTVTGAPGTDDYLTANTFPAVAHNPAADEYLLVWRQVDIERDYLQVMAQRLARDGEPVGQPVAVSQHGSNDYSFGSYPVVTYDSVHDDYLVFWDGFTGPDFASRRIFVRRVAATGAPIGDSVPLSDVGIPGSYPAVAFDPVNERHAVAWVSHESRLDEEDVEYTETEIYVQLFKRDADGAIFETGADMRLSSIGGYPNDGSLFWASAHDLDLAYSSARGEFLVVWSGSELVLRGQWFNAQGEEHGDDFTLTEDWGYPVKLAGDDSSGNLLFVWGEHSTTDFAYNSEYARVVGGFIDPVSGLLGEKHVFAELADAEHPDFGARLNDVVWNPAGLYLIAWTGNTVPVEERPLDETSVAILIKEDVYVTRVDVTGMPLDSTKIGTTGPEGIVDYRTAAPAVTVNEGANQYQVVWFADDDAGDMVDGKYELFGQQLSFDDADLSVRVEAEPASGGYLVIVENTSGIVARDVHLTWTQPDGVSIHFADAALCGDQAAQAGCSLGDLAPATSTGLFMLATRSSGMAGEANVLITAATQSYESDTADNMAALVLEPESTSPDPVPNVAGGGGGALSWLSVVIAAAGFRRRRINE